MTSDVVTNGEHGMHTQLRPELSALKVKQDRLMKAIHEGCEFGAAHRYGE